MRIKKIAINSIIETSFYIVIAFIGLLKIRFIISGLGTEVNGYFQFINQIITYIILAEAGLSAGILFKYYKPMANNDRVAVSKLFEGSKRIFRRIGLIIIALSILMIPLLMFYGSGSGITTQIIVAFSMLILAQAIPFLTKQRAYNALLAADQKRYVFAFISNSIRVLCDIAIIFMVIRFQNIVVIAFVSLISSLILNIVMNIVGKRMYSWLNKKHGVDTSATDMSKDLIVHQVGNVVYNNIDIVIIMTFLGPVMVSIYAAYNYIVFFIKELMDRNNNMIFNVFGNISAKENKEQAFKLFSEYIALFNFLALVLATCFILGARSFVLLWIGKSEFFLSFVVILLFGLIIFFDMLVKPIISKVNANGLYKETKYISLIISGINLGLSIILVINFGIAGTLLATCIASFIGLLLRVRVIRQKILDNNQIRKVLSYQFLVCVIFGIFLVGYYFIEKRLLTYMTSYINWFLIMGGIAIITTIFFFIFQYVTDKSFRDLVVKLKNYRWGEKENA